MKGAVLKGMSEENRIVGQLDEQDSNSNVYPDVEITGNEVDPNKPNKPDKKKKKESNKLYIIIAILSFLLCISFSQTVTQIYREHVQKQQEKEYEFTGTTGLLEGEIDLTDKEELQRRVNEAVEKSMFQIFINSDIKIDKNGVADIGIQNNKNNHYDCFVTIDDHEGNEIYKSPVMKPGFKVEADVLNCEFEEGKTYDCISHFYALDANGEIINCINGEIKITQR